MLLEEVQEKLSEEVPGSLNFSISPKISKGENYLGLPYVILDHPRISKDQNLFFVRSMFWWGHFFSSTLHLSGDYKEKGSPKLQTAYDLLSGNNYFVGINADPWQHHFGEGNYKRIKDLSKTAFATVLEESAHIKIAAFWPLQQWNKAANNLIESWKLLTGLIA